MARVRKAYSVAMIGHEREPMTVYAPTASKARADAYSSVSDLWDISFKTFLKELAFCRREPGRDATLPDPHPLRHDLDPRILHCVVHAYGGKGLHAGYRDHFYANEGDWQLRAAFYHGLFDIHRRDKGRNGRPGMIMYALTTLGRSVAAGEGETYPRAWS